MKGKIFSFIKSFEALIIGIAVLCAVLVLAINPVGNSEDLLILKVSEMESEYAYLRQVAENMSENKSTDVEFSDRIVNCIVETHADNSKSVTLVGANTTTLKFTLLSNYELQLPENDLKLQQSAVAIATVIAYAIITTIYILLVAIPAIGIAFISKIIYQKVKAKKVA